MSLKNNLKKQIYDAVKKEASKMNYEHECPKCNQKISVASGQNICPYCGHSFSVALDFNF